MNLNFCRHFSIVWKMLTVKSFEDVIGFDIYGDDY